MRNVLIESAGLADLLCEKSAEQADATNYAAHGVWKLCSRPDIARNPYTTLPIVGC
jgi:hypothetical protein